MPASVQQSRRKIGIERKGRKENIHIKYDITCEIEKVVFSMLSSYLYQTNNRAAASSHPTNYLVDLCWLVQLTHSFLVVAHFQRHEHHLTVMSIHSESFCRFSGYSENNKNQL